jgi:hypothetical protein
MDDIKEDGSPASEGMPPPRKEEPRRVGPESEVRGGPESPEDDLPDPGGRTPRD